MNDYKERKYLSSIEAGKYLGITVQALHGLVKTEENQEYHCCQWAKKV